jgi:hypothetical protein
MGSAQLAQPPTQFSRHAFAIISEALTTNRDVRWMAEEPPTYMRSPPAGGVQALALPRKSSYLEVQLCSFPQLDAHNQVPCAYRHTSCQWQADIHPRQQMCSSETRDARLRAPRGGMKHYLQFRSHKITQSQSNQPCTLIPRRVLTSNTRKAVPYH